MIKVDTSITKKSFDLCDGRLCSAQLCLPQYSARKSPTCWIHGYDNMKKISFALNRNCKLKFDIAPEFNQFCVEYEKDETQSNSCQGLSGSPIVCEENGRLVLAGITSLSKCRAIITELHEDIFFSNGWIRDVVKNY